MPDPECLAKPIRQLELEEAGIRTIVWEPDIDRILVG